MAGPGTDSRGPAPRAQDADASGEIVEASVAVGRAGEGVVETSCRVLSQLALVVMVLVVGVDIFTRWLLNYSFELAEEIGGYMLVAMAFFGLAVTQAHDGFHRVELVLGRLSPRGRITARIVYDLVAMAFAVFLLWYFWRFEMAAYASGNTAPTRLMTPLWIPQLPMVLGMLAYVFALGRTIARNAERYRSAAPGGNG